MVRAFVWSPSRLPRALVVVVEVAVAVAAVLVVTVAVAFAGPPTANPTAAPTFSAAFDGTLLRRCVTWCARVLLRQQQRGLHAAHARHLCPSRHGLFVQGPMLLARWAATNAPPTIFASKPRAPARLLRPPLGRPMGAARPSPATHVAATLILRRAAFRVSTSTRPRLAPVSRSRSCCAPVRGSLHAHRGFSLCTHLGTCWCHPLEISRVLYRVPDTDPAESTIEYGTVL